MNNNILKAIKEYAEIKSDTNRVDIVSGYVNITIANRKLFIPYKISPRTIEYTMPMLPNYAPEQTRDFVYFNFDPYNKLVERISYELALYLEDNKFRPTVKKLKNIIPDKYTIGTIASKQIDRNISRTNNKLKKFIWRDILSRPRRLPSIIEILQKKKYNFVYKDSHAMGASYYWLSMAEALSDLPLDIARLLVEKSKPTYTTSIELYLMYTLTPHKMHPIVLRAIDKTKGANRRMLFGRISDTFYFGLRHDGNFLSPNSSLMDICSNIIKHNDKNIHSYILSRDFNIDERMTPTIIHSSIRYAKRMMKLPNAQHPSTVLSAIRRHIRDSEWFVPKSGAIIPKVNDLQDKMNRAISLAKKLKYSERIHEFMIDDARLQNKDVYEADTFPLPESLKPLEELKLKKGGDLIKYGSEYRHCLGGYAKTSISEPEWFFKYNDAIGHIRWLNDKVEFVQCNGPRNQQNENTKKLSKMLNDIISYVTPKEMLETYYSVNIQPYSPLHMNRRTWALNGTDNLPF